MKALDIDKVREALFPGCGNHSHCLYRNCENYEACEAVDFMLWLMHRTHILSVRNYK